MSREVLKSASMDRMKSSNSCEKTVRPELQRAEHSTFYMCISHGSLIAFVPWLRRFAIDRSRASMCLRRL